MQRQISYETNQERTELTFGERDGKGRELGAVIVTSMLTAGPGPLVHRSYDHHGRVYGDYFSDATRTYYPHSVTLQGQPAGLYYTAYVQATRAGKSFGAGQPREIFDSAEAREAWIAKRIAAARRRAPKAATTGRSGRRSEPDPVRDTCPDCGAGRTLSGACVVPCGR